ncbi:VCBS repeat-containing protein [Isosphaeraceae bacterium EP7]
MIPSKAGIRGSRRARGAFSPRIEAMEPRALLASVSLTGLGGGVGGPHLSVSSQAQKVAANDFDGDGQSDMAVYDPTTSVWAIRNSSGAEPTVVVWGRAGSADIPLTGDFDGDRKADLAIYSPETAIWFIRHSSGAAPMAMVWGRAGGGDVPMVGDFDGDGKADLAVYEPSTAIWTIRNSGGAAAPTTLVWGGAGGDDVPLVADFDGDGKADLAVFSPSTKRWYIGNSVATTLLVLDMPAAAAGMLPTAGDYNGDGKADPTLYHPAQNFWTYLDHALGLVEISGPGGVADGTRLPMIGDYNGDGFDDRLVYTPSTSEWRSGNLPPSLITVVIWGRANSADVPLGLAVTPVVAAAPAANPAFRSVRVGSAAPATARQVDVNASSLHVAVPGRSPGVFGTRRPGLAVLFDPGREPAWIG